MKNEITSCIAEFESIYNGEPFYGKSLMAIVAEANPGKAFYKPSTTAHSAYEVLHHLNAWRTVLTKKLNGDFNATIESNSKEDWSPLPKQQTEVEWQKLLKQVQQTHKELIAAISKYSDASLDKNFADSSYTLRTYLNGQMQHDIYHTGQIALALKNA